MRVDSINSVKNITFEGEKNKKSNKRKIFVLCASALIAGGALLLANYNRARIAKPDVINVVKSTKDDFLKFCREAKLESYVASVENIENKIFRNDLHSHSNHSDGWGQVSDILNQVAQYADELYAKTGKKFNFALTDHDKVSGVREALDIIKNNPDKYKNVNFIPGVELSFSFNSNGQVKAGELLAYFINPESKAMKTLVEDLNKNRLDMINAFVETLGAGFNRRDLNKYFLNDDGETFAYNLHYRLRNYAQIKARVNKMVQEQRMDASVLYPTYMDEYVFGNGRVPKPFVSPEGFDAYLKKRNIQTQTPVIDEDIQKICEEFFPKIENGHVISKTENSFEKIIDTLKDDDNVVLGFAHPYFTAKQMSDFRKEFDALLKYADGKIKLSENYHQSYPANIPNSQIEEINKYLLEKGLIPIGGRDNHSSKFL